MSVAASLSQEVFGSIQSCHRDLNWKLLVPTEFNISKHDARQEAQGRNVRHTILAESGSCLYYLDAVVPANAITPPPPAKGGTRVERQAPPPTAEYVRYPRGRTFLGL